MCQRIGLPPISIIGFGRVSVSSLMPRAEPAGEDDCLHDGGTLAKFATATFASCAR